MLFRLVRPMRRKGSSKHQFNTRIPSDVRPQLVGKRLSIPFDDEVATLNVSERTTHLRFSLKSADPSIVKRRQAEVLEFVERYWQSLRQDAPLELTHPQAVAVSGDLYRAWSADLEAPHKASRSISLDLTPGGEWVRGPARPDDLAAYFKSAATLLEDPDEAPDRQARLDKELGKLVERLLVERGIGNITDGSHAMIVREFRRALLQAFKVQQRKWEGDYRPDPDANRFPDWQAPCDGEQSGPGISLTGLVDDWWRLEAERGGKAISTYETYKRAFTMLADFLHHDDATRVTEDDVQRFKEHRLTRRNFRTGKGLSLKTVGHGDLAALKSIFRWACENRRLSANPAANIVLKPPKQIKLRDSWFTTEEASAILVAALLVKPRKRWHVKRLAAYRWVPWLCAYTGARVGEIIQLRKKDVQKREGYWAITITPEAVTVKGKHARIVPIHEHLIALGFLTFVEKAAEGPLFMWSGDGRPAWRTAKNKLREFAREIVTDPNVQPNHAWRYTFKTRGHEAGIQTRTLDAITGHAPRSVGDEYTDVTFRAMRKAMELFPRYEVDLEAQRVPNWSETHDGHL